ncbi:tetratricopeptide repeat-containing sulfotransferase family protein [Montanilutibacter psychrotolerans]|uniref:Sulfotransferase family protein n=1 Tax=Montanilutibacter psychrotolerans TaxID=1327343 RepID=A0A3M8SXF5_9GAMM|nr:sulfotransferase [Lysobacter psychrotolerans]RNF85987.1 sulfotransferase family protein [Lysobacter psychrotolerans]
MSEQDVQKLWRQGEEYARQGQANAALSAYEALIAIKPDHVLGLLRASRIAQSLGRYRVGHGYVMRALAERPSGEEAVLTLARALRMYNEPGALLECVQHSRWRERRSAEWLTELAMLVSTIGDNHLAMQLLDLAIVRDPRHPPTRYFRGVVQMFFGDMDAAERELELCIARAPGFAQAHWVLSRLRKQTENNHHVDRMAQQFRAIPRGGDSEVYLSFAMHNELHDLGRHDESWRALDNGCRLKRRLAPHNRGDAQRMYDGLQSLCDAGFVQAHAPVEPEQAPFVPVFIVGMHRSGSTLLEQLLGGHPQVADGGETYSFTTQMRYAADYRNNGVLDAELVRRAAEVDYELVGSRFLAHSQWRAKGKPYLTEKLPSNFLNLGFIARALPQARILHMVRDPLDTCFSNLRTMFSDVNTFSYDQAELAEWFGQYRRLMAHWHSVMPGRVLDVHYDALVADPEAVMRGVLDFCDLPWDAAATSLDGRGAVATASSPQMRGGIIKNRSAAWAPYEAQLQPLINGLSGLA